MAAWPMIPAHASAHAGISVHDARGRLVSRPMPASDLGTGSYAPIWDGRDRDGRLVESGIYFAQLSAGGETFEWRIVIAR